MKKQEEVKDESVTLKKKEFDLIMSSKDIAEVKKILWNVVERKKALKLQKEKEEQDKLDRLVKKCKALKKYKAEEFREDLIKKQTEAEKRFKIVLKLLQIEYEFQKIFYTETTFFIADFYLPKYKVVYEIDGGYHNEKKQKIKDDNRSKELKKFVRQVYRLTNKCLDNIDLTSKKVKESLKIK